MVEYKDRMTLGEALSAEIEARHITKADAAVELGTSAVNVTRWCAGVVPKPEHHADLRLFLDLDDTELARALHAQRTSKPHIEYRMDLQEQTVAELRDEVAEIRRLLVQLSEGSR